MIYEVNYQSYEDGAGGTIIECVTYQFSIILKHINNMLRNLFQFW